MRRRGGRLLVRRFGAAEIAFHWLFAVDAAVLTLSGLGLYLGPGSNPVLDRRELMRTVHIDAAVILLLLPAVVAAAHPGVLRRLWRDVDLFGPDDWRWLRRVWVPGFLRRRPLPSQGRFNAGQKLNTIAIAAATCGFVGTGVLMDLGGHLPSSLSEAADDWHVRLMFLCAPLVAGHVLLALVLPSTRPAMRGMVTGWVRLDFARRRHGAWAAGAGEPPPPRSETDDHG